MTKQTSRQIDTQYRVTAWLDDGHELAVGVTATVAQAAALAVQACDSHVQVGHLYVPAHRVRKVMIAPISTGA